MQDSRSLPVPWFLGMILAVLLLVRFQGAWSGEFASDDAYVNLTIAGQALAGKGHSVAGEPVPAVQQSGWRMMSGMLGRPAGGALAGMKATAALSLVLFAWAGISLLRQLSDKTSYLIYGTVLLLCTPSVVQGAVDGSGMVAGSALFLLALTGHVKAYRTDKAPLPLASALWLGLAACIRLEWILVWLVFTLHALLVSHRYRSLTCGKHVVLLRMVNGLLMIGLMLTPAVAWNFRSTGVFWPRFPDSPMSLDAVAAGEGSYFSLLGGAVSGSYARLLSLDGMGGAVLVLFTVASLVLIVMQVIRKDLHPGAMVLPLFLVLPLLYACMYPLTGWNGWTDILAGLQPAWLVAVALGVAQAATWVREKFAVGFQALPVWSSALILIVVIGFLPFANSVTQARTGVVQHKKGAESQMAARSWVETALGRTGSGRVIATDQPGWIAWRDLGRVVDLRGELDPVLLWAWNGRTFIPADAMDFCRERNVTGYVLWGESVRTLEPSLSCDAYVSEDDGSSPVLVCSP